MTIKLNGLNTFFIIKFKINKKINPNKCNIILWLKSWAVNK